MTMQYDVKAAFLSANGTVTPLRNRIKGVFFAPTVATNPNATFVDTSTAITGGTYSQSTTTITVTKTAHGLTVGQRVALEFTSGSGASGGFVVATTPTANTFTVVTPLSGTNSGNVTVYTGVLLELPVVAVGQTAVVIPGEGILSVNGIYYVGFSDVTVFYG